MALVAMCSATNIWAQKPETFESFFVGNLNGEQIAFSEGKKVKIKAIDEVRSKVWKAWTAANSRLKEEMLLPIAPLSSDSKSKWHLPESLEPNAIMPYYFGSKGDCPNEGYPLFLYLHGSGPKAAEWSTGLKLAQIFDDGPSLYFVPQIPNEGQYYRWYQKSKQYAYEKLFRQAMLRDEVNANRLYVLGISEGGYGSQRFASFYADYLAAAGPMAGGEPLKNAPVENCRHIGFSFLTGALDKGFYRDILTTYTREAFDSLQTLHPDAFKHRIELVPNRAHGIDYRPTTPWLKNFVRNPWPKEFTWEDFEMDGRHRKGFYNIVVRQRPDEKQRTRYDVKIDNNVVNIKVQQVQYETIEKDSQWGIEMKFHRTYSLAEGGKFTCYLNEHLVDLSRKVTVIVNGKKVFNGKLRCNTTHMANSLATFFDSQRIYPAAVEVEY